MFTEPVHICASKPELQGRFVALCNSVVTTVKGRVVTVTDGQTHPPVRPSRPIRFLSVR
jgi:hypothetical protein